MIIQEMANTSPNEQNILATKLDTMVIAAPSGPDVCDCLCRACPFELPVFAKVSGEDPRENDFTAFLMRKIEAADITAVSLWKLNEQTGKFDPLVELLDDTYGQYFPIGTWTDCPGQELYRGYKLDWSTVIAAFGVGKYYIKGTVFTAIGQDVETFSAIYDLKVYSDAAADCTVRLDSVQNGNILSSDFNYTAMNWEQSIRLPGILWKKEPEIETDEFLDSERRIKQIQDRIRNFYTLEIRYVSDAVSAHLIENQMMANRLTINDYNRCNTAKYNELPVRIDSIEESNEEAFFNGRSHVIRVKDRFENIIKRNVK